MRAHPKGKNDYLYLLSLAMRTNPFRPEATGVDVIGRISPVLRSNTPVDDPDWRAQRVMNLDHARGVEPIGRLASWEGHVLEEILQTVPNDGAFFGRFYDDAGRASGRSEPTLSGRWEPGGI